MPAPPRTSPTTGPDNRRADLVRVAAQRFRGTGFEATAIRDIAHAVDWRSLQARSERRGAVFKDRCDAIWQATLDQRHRQGRLRTDAKPARPMILGALNFWLTGCRGKPLSAKRVGLDAFAAQTVVLVPVPVPVPVLVREPI